MSRSGPTRTSISVEEAAGERLELLLAELLGVDDHAALAAAVRDADDRALPGHPHREGLDLVEADVLVVADAALGRPAAEVVLDAVAGEDLDRAVVHLHREVDGQLAAGLAQDAAEAGVEVEPLGGQVELLLGDLPGVDRRSRRARSSWNGADLTVRSRPRRCGPSARWRVVSRTAPRSPRARPKGGSRGWKSARSIAGPRLGGPPAFTVSQRRRNRPATVRYLALRDRCQRGRAPPRRRSRAQVRPDRRPDDWAVTIAGSTPELRIPRP